MRLAALAASLLLALPVAAAPAQKITIDIQDAEVGNVLRLLADVSGLNFVYGDEVKGKITIKLKNVPWDQALDAVLQTRGLGQERKGNIVRIAPLEKLQAEEVARLDLREKRVLKGPLMTRIIPVNYARAAELLPLVQGLLSARGTASVDERTNTLIVKDVAGSSAFDLR